MKKARILVTAIAVFAVVSGALAFKARTFSPSKWIDSYCTASSSNVTCAGYQINVSIVSHGTTYYGFITNNTANCISLNCGTTQVSLAPN